MKRLSKSQFDEVLRLIEESDLPLDLCITLAAPHLGDETVEFTDSQWEQLDMIYNNIESMRPNE